MKQYFLLLTSGLLICSTVKPVRKSYPSGVYILVEQAHIMDINGNLARIVPQFFLETGAGVVASRWEEPVAEQHADPATSDVPASVDQASEVPA